MDPIIFLKDKLEHLSIHFPQIHIKYKYNNTIGIHVVQLTPFEEYYFNTNLDEAWISISLAFKNTFELEDIAFISSDSTLAINDIPTLEWNPNSIEVCDTYFYTNFLSQSSNLFMPKSIEFPQIVQTLSELPIFFTNLYSTSIHLTISSQGASFNTNTEISSPISRHQQQYNINNNLMDDSCNDEFPLAA